MLINSASYISGLGEENFLKLQAGCDSALFYAV